jgi:hypothetical protein
MKNEMRTSRKILKKKEEEKINLKIEGKINPRLERVKYYRRERERDMVFRLINRHLHKLSNFNKINFIKYKIKF